MNGEGRTEEKMKELRKRRQEKDGKTETQHIIE